MICKIRSLIILIVTLISPGLYSNSILYIPKNVLTFVGLNSTFVAKFCLFIALILVFTIFIGEVLKLFLNIPIIAGQIIAGIILGPSILNIANWTFFSDHIIIGDSIQNFGIISSDLFIFIILLISGAFTISYLLWLAGYETNLSEMIKVGPTAILAGSFGAVIPIVLMMIVVLITLGLDCSLVTAIGIGIIFSATSVSIPVAMLVSQQKMHLRSSKATLGAAIIDDILAVLILSLFIALLQSGFLGYCNFLNQNVHASSIFSSIVKIFAAFLMFFVVGITLIPALMNFFNKNKLINLIAPFAFIFMLIYFSFAELGGGLAGITGAYFAGIFQRRVDKNNYSEHTISPFISAIFLPIFLASVGLQVDVTTLSYSDWFVVLILLLLAILSKIFSVYLATFISNLFFESKKWTIFESYIFGSSMVARGEVGLVVATLLKNVGIIDESLYTISVVVIILTTIATPIMLSIGFGLKKSRE